MCPVMVMGPGVGIKGSLGPVGEGFGGGQPEMRRPRSHGVQRGSGPELGLWRGLAFVWEAPRRLRRD